MFVRVGCIGWCGRLIEKNAWVGNAEVLDRLHLLHFCLAVIIIKKKIKLMRRNRSFSHTCKETVIELVSFRVDGA